MTVQRTPLARPIRIGITGPIGCGKSTVAAWLGELGAVVIDADKVARDVTPIGSAPLAAVVDAFGSEILRTDGSLDRAALGRIVFADPDALARLESIIHPAVRPRILELLAEADRSSAPAVAIEAIKLVEGGLASLCDEVWLVTCDPAVQRERVAARSAGAARPTRDDTAAEAAGSTAEADTEAAGSTAEADTEAAGSTAEADTEAAGSTAEADTEAAGSTAEADTEAAGSTAEADTEAAGSTAEADTEAARRAADAEARIAAQGDLVARLTPFATRILDTSGSIAESRSRVAAAWANAMIVAGV